MRLGLALFLMVWSAPVWAQTPTPVASPALVHPLVRAIFTPLDVSVTRADLLIDGAVVAASFTPFTCPSDATKRCLDVSVAGVTRGVDNQVTIKVSNALGEVASSNSKTFQVPPNPVAPTLDIQVLP